MGWLILLAAILGLVFPPLAIVILAMMVLGVFAKGMGMTADSEEQSVGVRRKIRHRRSAQRPEDEVHPHVTQPEPGQVIDVPCYPIPLPGQLPLPTPKSAGENGS
jgi:hypothetical protein